jgi:hypothetical protein
MILLQVSHGVSGMKVEILLRIIIADILDDLPDPLGVIG